MAYYCDEIFSNHVGEKAAVKQTVFFRAVLTMILVTLCSVTCTVKCHMHSDSDPSATVCQCRDTKLPAQELEQSTQPSSYPAVPDADAIKLPSIRHGGFVHCVCKWKPVSQI